MVYGDRSAYRGNQGDVFQDVPFAGFTMDGMILSHDCVCDKYLSPKRPLPQREAAKFVVTVAPVHPLARLTGQRPAAARDGAMPRYFYLADEAGRGELVVDLYLEQPVRMAALMECARATSLSEEALGRLWQQFLRLRLGEDYIDFLRGLVDAG